MERPVPLGISGNAFEKNLPWMFTGLSDESEGCDTRMGGCCSWVRSSWSVLD